MYCGMNQKPGKEKQKALTRQNKTTIKVHAGKVVISGDWKGVYWIIFIIGSVVKLE